MSTFDRFFFIFFYFYLFFFFDYRGCPGQLARTSTNPTGPEVNDHVSLQWPSYEHSQGSNLRPKREQTPSIDFFNKPRGWACLNFEEEHFLHRRGMLPRIPH
jgi:hypothetical protein